VPKPWELAGARAASREDPLAARATGATGTDTTFDGGRRDAPVELSSSETRRSRSTPRSRVITGAIVVVALGLAVAVGLVGVLAPHGPAASGAAAASPASPFNPCTPGAYVKISGDRRLDGCAANFSARVVGSTFGFGASLLLDRTASILDGQVTGYHGPGTYRLQAGGAAHNFVEVVQRGETLGKWEPAGGTVHISPSASGLHIAASETIVTRSGQNATITVEGDITVA
jgi:hypothetical protein